MQSPCDHRRRAVYPGFERIRKGVTEVEVLESHWEPFFATIAGRYGLTEASLRAEFVAAAG